MQRLSVKPLERGEGSQAVAKLFARDRVEDLELQRVAYQDASLDQRILETGAGVSDLDPAHLVGRDR